MTPPAIKALIADKLSATRKNDKGKLVKICQELGEWFTLHLRYQDAINEYMDLLSHLEVSKDNLRTQKAKNDYYSNFYVLGRMSLLNASLKTFRMIYHNKWSKLERFDHLVKRMLIWISMKKD